MIGVLNYFVDIGFLRRVPPATPTGAYRWEVVTNAPGDEAG
jgi:hypothetical protein